MIDYCFWCGREFDDEDQGFEVYDKSFCCEKCLHEYEKTDNGIADKRSLYYYCDQCGKAIPKNGGNWWHRELVTKNLNIQRRFCTSECCTQFYIDHPDEYNRAQRIEEENVRQKEEEEQRKRQEEQRKRQEEERRLCEEEAIHGKEWKAFEKKMVKVNKRNKIIYLLKNSIFLIMHFAIFVLFFMGLLPEKLFPLVLFSCGILDFICSIFTVGYYMKPIKGKAVPDHSYLNIDKIRDISSFLMIVMPIINFLWLIISCAISEGLSFWNIIKFILSSILIYPYNLIGGWSWKFLSSVNPLLLGLLNVIIFYGSHFTVCKEDFHSEDKWWYIFCFLGYLYHLILSISYFFH